MGLGFRVYCGGYSGIEENKMEATILYGLYSGYIGLMENKARTTIMENQMEKRMEHEMETREYILTTSEG